MRQFMKVSAILMLLLVLTVAAFGPPPDLWAAGHPAGTGVADEATAPGLVPGPVERVQRAPQAQITVTRRISIPYGFDSPLPLLDSGQRVRASGHGACTENQQVTIAVTVTQTSTGAIATGTKDQTCTGQEQSWWLMATTETITPMAEAPVEACGLAQTREVGSAVFNDSFEWCVGVDLLALDQQTYLPLTQR